MILGLCVTVLGKPCKTFHCSYRKKEYASAQESGSNPLKISALIITMDAHDMYRLGMISKSELKRRQQERARAQFEMMENCDNGNFFPAQFHGMLLHCRSWGLLWRKPMLKESLWSFSIRNAGGIITGVGTAQSWPLVLPWNWYIGNSTGCPHCNRILCWRMLLFHLCWTGF